MLLGADGRISGRLLREMAPNEGAKEAKSSLNVTLATLGKFILAATSMPGMEPITGTYRKLSPCLKKDV